MLESRYFPRAPVDVAATFTHGVASTCRGRLTNISEGGALAHLSVALPVGSNTSIKVALPNRAEWLTIEAVVVRCELTKNADETGYEVGVEWGRLRDTDAERIGAIVAQTQSASWTDPGATIPHEVAVHYVSMIRRIAHGIVRRLPSHVSTDDLVGAGFVGFVDFYSKNWHLPPDQLERATKARIRGAMLDELRNADPLSRRMRRRGRTIEAARHELEIKHGRAVTHDEIVEHLKITPEEYARVLCAWRASRAASLDKETGLVANELIAEAPEVSDLESMNKLRTALDALPARLKKVLELHYGDDLTLRAIGNILGVSEVRISQLLSNAVRRLRDSYSDEIPAPPKSRRAPKANAPVAYVGTAR